MSGDRARQRLVDWLIVAFVLTVLTGAAGVLFDSRRLYQLGVLFCAVLLCLVGSLIYRDHQRPPPVPADQPITDEPWRVGSHYGIHVYAGDRPVATFHHPADAERAVGAVNQTEEKPDDRH